MKKRILVIGVGSVLLLAGAAFVGGHWLNGQGRGFDLPFGSLGNGKAHQGLYLNLIPASEIPTGEPAASGMFVRRVDNSLFIGSGNKQVQVQPADQGGSVTEANSYPSEVEVVVTHGTRIYHDDTSQQFAAPPQNGQTVQQVVVPGKIDEIGEGSAVQVWGQQNGNRILADVLLYSTPSYLPTGVPKP